MRAALGAVIVTAGTAHAQPAPTAPIDCYDLATDEGLASTEAVRLCRGATSDMPARCFAWADDALGLSDQLGVDLCAMATSEASATCAAQLDASNEYSDPQIVRFCAAQPWPVVAAPGAGSARCVQAAADQTTLEDTLALSLCRGGNSTAPVACFLAGDDRLAIDDRVLVELCGTVFAWRPATGS
jgi:hypothetical protein